MKLPNLNRRLELQAPERVPDGAGGFETTWATLGVHWAEVKGGSGRERLAAALTLSTVPTRVTVRGAPVGASARPRPEQRFKEGSRVFRILAVTETDAMGRYLTCLTEEETVA
ncbi:MAG: head-tail adaptor protein [Pseudomonadota bacterium]